VSLAEGEQIETKPGAMMTQSAGIENETNVGGDDGVVGMDKRAISDERGLVKNTYYAVADDSVVTLVPAHPGDIARSTSPNEVRSAPSRDRF